MTDLRNSRMLVLALLVLVAAGAGFLLGRVREARTGDGAGETASAAGGAPPAVTSPAPSPVTSPAPAVVEAEPAAPAPAAAAPRAAGGRSRREVAPPPASARESEPAEDDSPPAGAAPEREAEREPVETTVVVPAGTTIQLRLLDGVSSQTAAIGQAVEAEVAAPLAADGATAIPAGARVHGRVTEVHALRKIGGRARLALAFESVEVGGRTVPLEAFFAREGKSETGKDAATIAAGAAVGTVLGNQADKNDRGKVLGGLIGAGVGTAIAAATAGEKVELAAGAELELTLRAEVPVRVRG